MRDTFEPVCHIVVYHTVIGLFSSVEASVVIFKSSCYVIRSACDLGIGIIAAVADFLIDLSERVIAVITAFKADDAGCCDQQEAAEIFTFCAAENEDENDIYSSEESAKSESSEPDLSPVVFTEVHIVFVEESLCRILEF